MMTSLLLLLSLVAAVISQTCDSACLTCNGTLANECLSCDSGLFLMGTSCILSCPFKVIPSNRTCVATCPTYFYENSYNGHCEECPSGCKACDSTETCYSWDNLEGSDIILQYLSLWLILSALVISLTALICWKLCCSYKNLSSKMEEEVIDHKDKKSPKKSPQFSHENIEPTWVEDIDDLHFSTIYGKRNQRTQEIKGIGKELSNI